MGSSDNTASSAEGTPETTSVRAVNTDTLAISETGVTVRVDAEDN